MNVTRLWLIPAFFLTFAGFLPAELDLQTLKDREAKVKEVVQLALPATVGIVVADGNGAGSGIVVNEDGLVLTAGHVSGEPGRELSVILPDGERVSAKSLGVSRAADAGMVQIEAGDRKFAHVDLGHSGSLEIGQWCVAMGHPGGFELGRTAPVRLGRVLEKNQMGFILTDSTLVGGDSGGPLFDLDGKLIGIHSSIGFDLAINRHVPIDVFHENWERLLKGEAWGQLGLYPGQAPGPGGAILGVVFEQDESDGEGVLIKEILKGSPAEKAGLKQGDRLLKVGDESVQSAVEVMGLVRRRAPGDKLDLLVRGENGKDWVVQAELARYEDFLGDASEPSPEEEAPEPVAEPKPFLGISVADSKEGEVVIAQVLDDSPAQKAGLKADDVLMEAFGAAVVTAAAFKEDVLKRKPGEAITLRIRRGEEIPQNLPVTLGSR